ncbi:D-amino acid dehydrogenase [Ottowia sp.]|uniref:D-amino acid dehydrogenase n=1 Tax=Ottowia sp. TaxID=1898956 RepID=UPI002B91EB74|nr:D-amino acid dehydrogenase [Ottowia sp.]HOB67919.1 D-amino acid dehydrogenase [Ottowia sp.]HPZ57188.1 D-amino acid dehydrogenase [Ottowia sp.]HQD49208.1 D-amino acid dehydrogenase [Ottowia sp.]
MNIAILGAGIIGVTTAYELAADGHQVTVFERHASVAEGASFANAGVVAPGYVTPWAAPGMPAKVLRHLLARHAPMRVQRPLALADVAWMRQWLRACNADSYASNRARMQRLAFYSRQRLHEVAARMAYDYDRASGYLVLLRGERDQRMVQPGLALLRELGVPFHEINADEARQIEPALHPHTPLAGAIHLPQDEVGNCRQFAVILRDAAEQLGARFVFNTAVTRIDQGQSATLYIANDAAPRAFDAIVLCAGVQSAALLRPLGVRLPLRPVYGYSISAHIPEPLYAPRSGVMDERYKVAITRMGQRVRVAGSAEIGGRADELNDDAIQTLYKVLADWFPGAARLSSGVQVWKGARPMLPDGPPVIGASGIPGLWLNLGHGSSGWALACGSARVLADQMAGRSPEIDVEGLGAQRWAARR